MLNRIIENSYSNPNGIAIWHKGKSYSYKELVNLANGISVECKKLSSQFIGLYTDNNFYTYAAILGILLANKSFVPLNHKFPLERLNSIIDSLMIKEAFCVKESIASVQNLSLQALNLEEVKTLEIKDNLSIKKDEIAYVLFTSGSTGVPKGIPISYNNLEALMDNIFKSIPMDKDDKVLQTFELSFDVSIACTFMAWIKGAALYVSPLDGIIAVNAFKTVLDNKVNWVCIAPSAITYLSKLKLLRDYPLPFVTQTIFTGEALQEDFTNLWNECATNSEIYNAYGPTENTVWSFVHKFNEDSEFENGLVAIGKPLSGFSFKLIDISNQGIGELYVSGKQVFSGYWENENKSKESLVNENGKLWYKTGDIVKMQDSGDLMYLNRADNQVQVNGYRVELGEVEYKIKAAIKVTNCVVYLTNLKGQSNYLCAVIERDMAINNQELEMLRKVIPFYMQPKRFFHLETFPINSNSKIDRKSIKNMFI